MDTCCEVIARLVTGGREFRVYLAVSLRGLLRKYNQDNANSVPTKRLATLTSRNQANRGLTSCGSARHGYCFLLFSALS